MHQPPDKVLSFDEALAWRQTCAREGRQVVITNGCFDLLHRGHVEYLNAARQQGDALLVAVNSDRSIQAVKGPGRPVVPEQDRVYLLASLACVDVVLLFDTPTAVDIFRRIPPDVYVKGGDYTVDTINREEHAVLAPTGCRFCFIPFVPGYSTTNLIARIRELGDEP